MLNGTHRVRRRGRLPMFAALLVLIGAERSPPAGRRAKARTSPSSSGARTWLDLQRVEVAVRNLAQTDPSLLGWTNATPVQVMISTT